MSAPSQIVVPRLPWEGGRKQMLAALVIGVVSLVLWFVSMRMTSTERAVYSWLWALLFWITPCLGAIGWICAFNAAKAKWIILPRRTLELIGGTVGIFAVLFVFVAMFMRDIYPWMRPEAFDEEARRLFEHRHKWMNQGMWFGRAILYFLIWIGLAERLHRWSLAQDTADLPENTAKAWTLSPAALPFLGFAISFAAFDWLMSLNVTFFSSMFGLYVIAGCAMSAMAVWILVTIAVKTPINGHHLHSMGKLMFAFNCFWAYTAFCQFMLIWIADIPDETPWHHMRIWSDWRYVGYFQIVFHFVLPFIILLSRGLKFDKRKLGFMAVWLLIAHAVDTYWIVMPQLTPDGPHFGITDLFAFLGVGGIAIGFFIFRMRGKNLVPIGDPFLPVSLEYRP
ncbi:MAG: hypothetical protein JWN44_1025 [Myxococcales bacterium]|nr:hypothetical protein [Myxococcales bacterium]